jgi:hypothetical protein
MGYTLGPENPADPSGNDRPGYKASMYFASEDCSGDPVMIPNVAMTPQINLREDLSNAIDLMPMASSQTAGVNGYQRGDLLEFDDNGYYIPFDAEYSYIEVRSFSRTPSRCQIVDRCDYNSWAIYPHALRFGRDLSFYPYEPVEECSNIIESASFPVSYPFFTVSGFTFSSLRPNDPAITGFENIAYKFPQRIKWVEVER